MAPLVPAVKKTESVAVMMNRFSVAGFQYYDGPAVLNRIRPGDTLTLRVEPQNPHDEFAVEIFHGTTKLGYIPRSDNRHISRLLANNVKLPAKVEYTRTQGPTWKAVKVNVYLAQ